MRPFLIASALAALVAAQQAPAAAAPSEDGIRMVSIDAAPWASSQPSGAVMGAFPAIVAEMAKRTGLPISVATVPFARIDRELEAGTQDCTIILWNDARARIVARGEEVYVMSFGIVARKDVRLTAYDDLKPLTVSVVRNLAIDPRFDADDTIAKDFDKDYAMGLHKIAHRRLDAVAGAIPTIMYQARRDGLSDHLGDRLVLNRIPLVLQCSKRSPNFNQMDRLNEALRSMRHDGTLEHILSANDYF